MMPMEYGTLLTQQRITPGNTVTGIAADIYKYAERLVYADSVDFQFAEGQVITGATSGAVAVVKSVTLNSGTVAGTDADVTLRVHSWNGIAFQDDEKIKNVADNDVGDIKGTTTPAEAEDAYPFKGAKARYAQVWAETHPQRVQFGANKFTTDQTTKFGVVVAANAMVEIFDGNAIPNINVVDTASGTGSSQILVWF
jgi:FlaG/FlaF family flagellin (archaellin)